jgi:uncharacterized membrane protein YdjX (TVP38/TMEM64 family)
MTSQSLPRDQGERRPSHWLRLALPILLIATFMVVAWKSGYFKLEHGEKLNDVASKARQIPWLGIVFTGVYATVAAFGAPVSPLAYGAGALFGIIRGTIAVWVGSMIGGIAGYWLARGVLADSAKRLLGRHDEKLRTLGRGNAFLMTFRAQLLPIIPFGMFNYAAGSMRLSFVAFVAGTALGILPGSVAAVVVGERVATGLRGGGRSAFLVAAAVMAALIGVSFLPNLVDRLRRR